MRLFVALFARYPSARLEDPELTLEAYVTDTAHLPIEELRACIEFATQESPTFVPPAPSLLDAYVKRRSALIVHVPIGNPCTLAELRLTAEHRARGMLRASRSTYIERVKLGPLAPMVDGIIAGMSTRPEHS